MSSEGVLHQAVKTGSTAAVEHVLKGLTPKHAANELAQTGSTPLHTAAWMNSLPIIAQLLDAGASANIPDEESGWSALAKALYFGHLRAAMLLLQRGASLDLLDNKGRQQQHLVYAWGSGANFQLGTGSTDFANSPIRVEPLVGCEAVYVACAKYHSAAISSDGHLLTWGWGRGGRLGHPDSHIHSGETALIKPWVVSSLGKRHVSVGIAALHRIRIIAIAAANKHSAAISASGDVYTWGANSWGQLGYGTSDSSANPNPRVVDALKGKPMQAVAAAKRHTLLLSRDGEVWTFGHKRLPPLDATINFHKGHSEVMRPTAVSIAAGYAHSCCLTATGAVLAWASADPQLRVKVRVELRVKVCVELRAKVRVEQRVEGGVRRAAVRW
ncbi:regulator of chromosome condensation 1/beta-lactamase-inhibitor protein II [Dunaliella salina]|uniref:Regulator of chromosome condensation 1/beta-lactamase-inhibitor protein II n=1 Tax=Dunaliella salina TaxID=3046 RepID=A0ABQ7H8S1_DUNSA|nr:regulator of chromosome condensation 1/beta-lactamase-inhibitor protein II [Dunaliella salina]|eukprot:KAF5843258.1 regulator of chromosome condensation 1/beta-lactamase-inhibitor protein II [Dunaliella salina]